MVVLETNSLKDDIYMNEGFKKIMKEGVLIGAGVAAGLGANAQEGRTAEQVFSQGSDNIEHNLNKEDPYFFKDKPTEAEKKAQLEKYLNELNIEKTSDAAIVGYKLAFRDSAEKFLADTSLTMGPIFVMNGIKNNNPEEFKKAKEVAIKYRVFGFNLKEMQVPENMAPTHLNAIECCMQIASNLEWLSEGPDPLIGMELLKSYKYYADVLMEDFNTLALFSALDGDLYNRLLEKVKPVSNGENYYATPEELNNN